MLWKLPGLNLFPILNHSLSEASSLLIRYFSRILPLLFILLTSCRAGGGDSPNTDDRPIPDVDTALLLASEGDFSRMENLAEFWGRGSWFALAAAADDSAFSDVALTARKRSITEDPAPFARISLSELLLENPRALRRPLREIRKAERRYGADESLAEARMAVLSAEGRSRALLKYYPDFKGRSGEAPVLAAALERMPDDLEVLARAERFILHCPDPDALTILPLAAFKGSDAGYDHLLKARIDFARGRERSALGEYKNWIEALLASGYPCSLEDVSPVFAEIAKAAEDTGREELWAEVLTDMARASGGARKFGAAFQSGRLYRALNAFDEAGEAFLLAAESRPLGLDRDRALWFRLRVAYQKPFLSNAEEMEIISSIRVSWENPDRFADRLEEYLHRRVRRGEWTLLEEAWQDWGATWPDSTRSLGALILAFAAHEGRVPGEGTVRSYLEIAAEADPLSWSGLRASGLLTLPLVIGEKTGLDDATSDDDEIVELYLRCGLTDMAYDAVLSRPGLYSAETIRGVSRALAEYEPRQSIRIAGLLWRRENFVPSREDLLLRHPRPYGNAASEAALVENLPPWIFHGLIRTESAWDAAATSRSGARGLSQFMPATWDEWVRRMRYPEDTDPADPEANMALGAAYLDWLHDRDWTYGWIDSLASYNAGGGRVRSWRRQRPGYGDDLFGESIPVEEPRSYIRKVLSAATLYGYLYADESPASLHASWGLDMIEVQQ